MAHTYRWRFRFMFAFLVVVAIIAALIGCRRETGGGGSFLDRATNITRPSTTTTVQTNLVGQVVDAWTLSGINGATVLTEGGLKDITRNNGINNGVFYFQNVPSSPTSDTSFYLDVTMNGYESYRRVVKILKSQHGTTVDLTQAANGGVIKLYKTSYAKTGVIFGQITDNTGTPIDGATIETTVLDPDTKKPYTAVSSSSIDKNSLPEYARNYVTLKAGSFFLELPAEPDNNYAYYSLVVKKDNYNTYSGKSPVLNIKLNRLETKNIGTIPLTPISEQAEKRDIAGQVVDENGNGLDGATVETEGGIKVISGNKPDKTKAGEFLIKNAPVGEYKIIVKARGYQTLSETRTITSGSGILSLSPYQFKLSVAGETLYGKVYDSESVNTYLSGATVTVTNILKTFEKVATAESTGLYKFLKSIPPNDKESYFVTAEYPNYVKRTKEIKILTGDNKENNALDFPLVKISYYPIIKGDVADKNNISEKIVGATVEWSKTGVSYVLTTETDIEGFFVLQGNATQQIMTGEGKLTVYKQGYKQTSVTVNVDVQENEVQTILLEKFLGQIWGYVYTDPDNIYTEDTYPGTITNAISGAIVTLTNRLTGVTQTTTSRIDGYYTFQDIEEGDYIISAQKDGYDINFYQRTVNSTTSPVKQHIELKESAGGTTKGYLTGLVYYKLPGSEEKIPVEGAVIDIMGFENNVATTNQGGRYNVKYDAGTYVLRATKANYADGYASDVVINANKLTTADIELTPASGNIDGTVYETVYSQGLAGVTVTLSLSGSSSSYVTITSYSPTDAGKFSFREIPYNSSTGSYLLTLQKDGYQDYVTNISVTQPYQSLAFYMSPKTGTITGHAFYDENSNDTYDTGEGLESVKILRYTASPLSLEATTYTDPDGKFEFKDVQIGLKTLNASLQGYITLTKEVSVLSGEVVVVNFNMKRLAGVVRGVVFEDLDEDGTYNSAVDKAIIGASVELLKNGVSKYSTFSITGGTYELIDVTAGSYILLASKANYSSYSAGIVVTTATLEVDAPLSSVYGTLTGRIYKDYDADGTRDTEDSYINGATVEIDIGGAAYQRTYTDTDGYFTIENIAIGKYQVKASASQTYDSNYINVEIKAGQVTTITLGLPPRRGNIQGIVSDKSTGAPLYNANVAVLNLSGVTLSTTTTLVGGDYSIYGLTVDNYEMVFYKTGYFTLKQAFALTVQTTETVNVSLSPSTGIVAGYVKDSYTDVAIQGASVSVDSGTPTYTDANGYFVLTGITPGTRQIMASHTDYAMNSVYRTIIAGETTSNVEIKLTPVITTARLFGVVMLSSETDSYPIVGASVGLNDGGTFKSVTTDGSGQYVITDLKNTTYTLKAEKTGLGSTTLFINITGTSLEQNIYIPRTEGGIKGLVYEKLSLQQDTPISDVKVSLKSSDESMTFETTLTNADGRYYLAGVTLSSYIVLFEKTGYTPYKYPLTVNSFDTISVDSNGFFSLETVYLETQTGTLTLEVGYLDDTSNFQPLTGVSIGVDGTFAGYTGPDGKLYLSSLTAGQRRINLEKSNFTSETYYIYIEKGPNPQKQLTMTPLLANAVVGYVYDKSSGNTINGASVSIRDSNSVWRSTYTNTTGKYVFTDVIEGDAFIKASKASDGYESSSISMTLLRDMTNEAPNIYLLKKYGAIITGTVRFQDEPSTGLAGASISVWGSNFSSETVYTDSNGTYWIAGITLGPVVVKMTYTDSYGDSYSDSKSITLNENNVTSPVTVDFELTKQRGTIIGIVKAKIGTITRLVSGASVEYNGNVLAYTDKDGNFKITGITTGTKQLIAHYPEYADGYVYVDVLAGQTVSTEIRLTGTVITGRVVYVDTFGEVQGLAGATVGYTDSQGKSAWKYVESSSGIEGKFTFYGLAEGIATIRAGKMNEGFSEETITITVTSGATVELPDIELKQLFNAKVYGYVTRTGTSPGVINSDRVNNGLIVVPSASKIAYTNTYGYYEISGLDASSGNPILVQAYFTDEFGDVLTNEKFALLSGLSTEQRVDFNLQTKRGAVKGLVRWEIPGLGVQGPLIGATITIDGVVRAHTFNEVNGINYAISGITPGAKTIIIDKMPDYLPYTETITFIAGQTLTLDVDLKYNKVTRIYGTVYDDTTGKKLVGASVTYYDAGGNTGTTYTDDQGTYNFSDLTGTVGAGRVIVSMAQSGYSQEALPVYFAAGETKVPDIRLVRKYANSISIEVSWIWNEPIAFAAVRMSNEPITTSSPLRFTNTRGQTGFEDLTEGQYYIQVTYTNELNDVITREVIVDILTGISNETMIQLTPANVRFSGKVIDGAGNAVSAAEIFIKSTGTTIASTTTGFDGKYFISKIATGVYTIYAGKSGYLTSELAYNLLGTTGLSVEAPDILLTTSKVNLGGIVYRWVTDPNDSVDRRNVNGASVSILYTGVAQDFTTGGDTSPLGDGRFMFYDLPVPDSGVTAKLIVNYTNYQEYRLNIDLTPNESPKMSYEINLKPLYVACKIRILDAQSSTPITGATCELRSALLATRTSDTNGFVEFNMLTPESTWIFDAEKYPAYNRNSISFTFGYKSILSAEVFLSKNTSTISGQLYVDLNNNLTFDTGTDMTIPALAVYIDENGVTVEAVADSSGIYSLSDVPYGTYTLQVKPRDIYTGTLVPVQIVVDSASETVDIPIAVKKVNISGNVSVLNSSPLLPAQNLKIYVNKKDGSAYTQNGSAVYVYTDINGDFTVYSVEANLELILSSETTSDYLNSTLFVSTGSGVDITNANFQVPKARITINGLVVRPGVNPGEGEAVPVTGASVSINIAGTWYDTQSIPITPTDPPTEPNFIFSNISLPSETTATVKATHSSWASVETSILLTVGSDVPINRLTLVMKPKYLSLGGIIMDNSTPPVTLANVKVEEISGANLAPRYTNTDGNFLINTLSPETVYTFRFSKTGYFTEERMIQFTFEPRTISVVLSKLQGTVTGVVWVDSDNDGTYVPANDTEIANAAIYLDGNMSNQLAVTDSSGNFTVENITYGFHTLIAVPETAEALYTSGSQGFYLDQTTLSNVNIEVNPITQRISGTVFSGESGTTPLGGALIKIFDLSENPYTYNGMEVFANSSFVDGSYTLMSIEPGTYKVRCEKTGFSTESQFVTVQSGVNVTGINFNMLSIYAKVSGVVKIMASSPAIPIAGASVSINMNGTWIDTVSDGSGNFEFQNLQPGSTSVQCYLVATAGTTYNKGYSASFYLQQGQTVTKDIELEFASYYISGTVRASDETGTPISGATITWTGGGIVTSDSTGKFTITGLSSMTTYTLTGEKYPEYSRGTKIVSLGYTSESNVILVLAPSTATVSGNVFVDQNGNDTFDAGEGVADIRLNIGTTFSATSGTDGAFTFTNVTFGTFTIETTPTSKYNKGAVSVDIRQKNVTGVEIQITPIYYSLYGYVIDWGLSSETEDGTFPYPGSLADIRVQAKVSGSSTIVSQYVTSGEGYFILNNLFEGTYDITFTDNRTPQVYSDKTYAGYKIDASNSGAIKGDLYVGGDPQPIVYMTTKAATGGFMGLFIYTNLAVIDEPDGSGGIAFSYTKEVEVPFSTEPVPAPIKEFTLEIYFEDASTPCAKITKVREGIYQITGLTTGHYHLIYRAFSDELGVGGETMFPLHYEIDIQPNVIKWLEDVKWDNYEPPASSP